jgi:hypothetical protein
MVPLSFVLFSRMILLLLVSLFQLFFYQASLTLFPSVLKSTLVDIIISFEKTIFIMKKTLFEVTSVRVERFLENDLSIALRYSFLEFSLKLHFFVLYTSFL